MSSFRRDLKLLLNSKNNIDDVNKIKDLNLEINLYFFLRNSVAVSLTY